MMFNEMDVPKYCTPLSWILQPLAPRENGRKVSSQIESYTLFRDEKAAGTQIKVGTVKSGALFDSVGWSFSEAQVPYQDESLTWFRKSQHRPGR